MAADEGAVAGEDGVALDEVGALVLLLLLLKEEEKGGGRKMSRVSCLCWLGWQSQREVRPERQSQLCELTLIALPFKILARKLRLFPADVERVSHLVRQVGNREERHSFASAKRGK